MIFANQIGFSTFKCSKFKSMANLEIWKDIPNNPFYQVSNFGNVRSVPRRVNSAVQKSGVRLKKQMILKSFDNGRGYRVVTTQSNNQKKNFYIHRIVAECFIENSNNLPQVNHIDGDKSNNHYTNLEWCTADQNITHAMETGLIRHGENAPNVKLTERDVLDILTAHSQNPSICLGALSTKYGVAVSVISRIISGVRWNRVWKKFHSKEAIELGISVKRTTVKLK